MSPKFASSAEKFKSKLYIYIYIIKGAWADLDFGYDY